MYARRRRPGGLITSLTLNIFFSCCYYFFIMYIMYVLFAAVAAELIAIRDYDYYPVVALSGDVRAYTGRSVFRFRKNNGDYTCLHI